MWGPPGWKYLHSVAHGFPDSPREYDALHGNPLGTTEANYKLFFIAVGSTLPCHLCRESYSEFLRNNPVRTSSREELTRWLWEIHNEVNLKLGRTYESADFESVKQSYEKFRAKCPTNSSATGCTVPLHTTVRGGSRCKLPLFKLGPLYLDCFYLKIFFIVFIVLFLYSRRL